MRDVVVYALLSLDGVAEEPSDWMSAVDQALFRNLAGVIAAQDDVLLGRGTHDDWAEHWPTSEVRPFNDFINTTMKHVFTSSPLEVKWRNTVVADAPLQSYVTRLREQAGGDIGVHGSIRLAQALMKADLVDRLELVVAPATAGRGRRLLTDDLGPQRLHLERSTSTPSGSLLLGYRRRRGD